MTPSGDTEESSLVTFIEPLTGFPQRDKVNNLFGQNLFFHADICYIQYWTILQAENWDKALQQPKHQRSNQEVHQKQMLVQVCFTGCCANKRVQMGF